MKLSRISLRELFLLVVIAAMGCGWWIDRQQNGVVLRGPIIKIELNQP
jgi:hypothetical protein